MLDLWGNGSLPNVSEPALQLNKEISIKLHKELINCYFIMKIIG